MSWFRAVTPSNGSRPDGWRKWRWTRALGRRGATLLFFGLLDITIAWSLMTTPPNLSAFLVLPPRTWAAGWAIVGGVCLCLAWMRPPRDALAFALGAAIKFLWGTAYMYAYFTHGLYRGWVSALIWWLFAVHVLITAGWAEPNPLHRDNGKEDGGVFP